MMMTCPNCKQEFEVSATAMLPKEQRITIEVSRENGYFGAAMIGELMINGSRLLKSTAKEIGGKVEVFLTDFKLTPTTAEIELLVADVKTK